MLLYNLQTVLCPIAQGFFPSLLNTLGGLFPITKIRKLSLREASYLRSKTRHSIFGQ